MDSSDEDFCWIWFLSFWHVAYNLFLFLLYTKDGYMYKIRATHKYYCGTKYNRRGMRDFRSSPLLAPVGSGFLQYSRNNHSQIMKKLQKIFSHPCGILCDLSIEKWDNIRNMRERYVVSAPGNSLYESYVFRCSPKQNSTYVLQLAEYILILFFRRHGSTRVRMYLVILQSNILVHTFFQVEVTTVNICSFFRIEIWREQKNTSVFKFGFHRSKRWDTTCFQTFWFCVH